ncbi:ATP-binding protein [Sphingomonas sp.]|uniref:sensor histidine kinase n=1 Tax=Sphingomonas sp. TaxID=28214 RepID=UPI001B2967E8|nr:ATP-binding protein [Sphingomonas sp.]MBO9712437.1 PAS-domain containing protein [Sphingomonas sp.]
MQVVGRWIDRLSFDARRALGVAAVEALLLALLIATVLAFAEGALEREIERDATVNSEFVARQLAGPLAAGDVPTVRHLAADYVQAADLAALEVRDREGRLVARAELADKIVDTLPLRTLPVVHKGEPVGSITARAQLDGLHDTLRGLVVPVLLLALVLLGASAIASWQFSRYLSRHLRAVRKTAERIRGGAFGATLEPRGAPDLRAVSEAINAMSLRLAELHAGQQAVIEERTRTLQSTFEHMAEGVAIFDAAGRLRASNPNFAGLAGLPPQSGDGITLAGLVDMHAAAGAYAAPEMAPFETLCRATEWDGPSLAFEMPMGDRIVAIRRTRLPDGGFIAIHEDVTRQRADQRRLLHGAKLATLGELATVTAHELNQPLNVIRLTADNARARVAEGRAEPDYLEQKLARIAEQTARAAAIIDHMRVFGRKPAEQPRPFDLGEAVRSAVGFFGETARLDGCAVELDIADGVMVRGHPSLIEQVVANLVSNALGAFRTNRTERPRLRIRVHKVESGAEVTVSDNGGGIPAEVLPHIFEPFFTTKGAQEGTGLGLSISYGIVGDMGGQLSAANLGDGTSFAFVLPLCAEAGG